jgi:hypothetical protein
MSMAKSVSSSGDNRKQPDTGRRSFIRKTGAAMSAVVASAVAGFAKPGSERADDRQNSETVRMLQRTYESRLDKGQYEAILDLFADKSSVEFNGGQFRRRESGLRRLYCEYFRSGQTGRKVAPPADFDPDCRIPDSVTVAPDGRSAVGMFPYSMQVGQPIEGDSSLIAMARLHGEGIAKWWEGGVCEATYVRVGKSWKIQSLRYRPSAKSDYRPGRSYARPIDVPAFAKTWPSDPTGPDKLV